MQCITCDTEHQYDFCPMCGESSLTPKITFSSMFNSGISTISNMDKGFLYNMKQLTIAPKQIILDYLKGKRKSILNPISYLIIAVTIYLIISSFFKSDLSNFKLKSDLYEIGYETGKFIGKYFKYFWISSIIWLSLSSHLVFKKYRFAEHMAINAFIIGQTTLVCAICELFTTWPLVFNPLVYIVITYLSYKVHQ